MLTEASRRLCFAGVVSLLGYAIVALFSWSNTTFHRGLAGTVVLVAGLAAPTFFYLRSIAIASQVDHRLIVIFAVCFALIGFVALPFDSTDVFVYMATGWAQAHYHSNPYAHTLREIPGSASDPMISNPWLELSRNHWRDLPLAYGFLFAVVSRWIARLGAGNWWLTLALFSALNLVAHSGIAVLLWKISRLLPDGNARQSLFLYAWNPLVITQFLANVHNDLLMAFFITLAVYFLVSGRPSLVIPALVAGGFIKYAAFALVPFAAIAVYRGFGKKKAALGAAYGAVVAVIVSAPYVRDLPDFKFSGIRVQLSESTTSLHAVLMTLARRLAEFWPQFQTALPSLKTGILVALLAAFLLFVGLELKKSIRAQLPIPAVIQQWLVVLACLVFVVNAQFYSWYIGMLLPLAALGYPSWLGRAVIAASTAHLLAFTGLRRKTLGYFLVCTLLPFMMTRRKRDPQSAA